MKRQTPILLAALLALMAGCARTGDFRRLEFTAPSSPDPALRPFLEQVERMGVICATNIEPFKGLDIEKVMARLSEAIARRLDTLTWQYGLITGGENHLWLVSASDFNQDYPGFRGATLTQNPDTTWTLRFKDSRTWTFNSTGWLIRQTDRTGNFLGIIRDSQNRVTALRDLAGRELTVSYSGFDTKIQSVTDPLCRQVRYHYDGSNRLTQVTNPANGTWTYTYDGSHRMRTVTNPRQILQTQNTYDAAGRVAPQTLADTGITRFTYTVVAGIITATTVT